MDLYISMCTLIHLYTLLYDCMPACVEPKSPCLTCLSDVEFRVAFLKLNDLDRLQYTLIKPASFNQSSVSEQKTNT